MKAGAGSLRSRILIVEDDPSVSACTARLLMIEGYDVVVIDDPVQALRAAIQEPWAAIICDQGLKGLKGLDLLRRFAESKPSLVKRFILATGAVHDPEVRRFAEARPRRTLFKPYRRAALLAAIEDASSAAVPAPKNPAPVQPTV